MAEDEGDDDTALVVDDGAAGDEAELSVPLTSRQDVSVCAEHKKPRRLLKHLGRLGFAVRGGGAGAPSARADAASAADGGGGGGGGATERRVLIFANKVKACLLYTSPSPRDS